jgi:hypothetical protein
MSMNATTLGAAIKSAIQSSGDPSLASNAQAVTSITDLANAIASAVVAHIQSHAVVTLAAGCLATGVTSGGATAPVTGTGTIS